MSTNVKEYVDSHVFWLFVLQGLVTVGFGIIALFFPGLTLASLVTWFAVFVTVVGVVELVHGFRDLGKGASWWFSLLVGVVMLGVGVYLVRNPAMDQVAFLATVGALVLVRGVADLFVSAFYSVMSEHRLMWVVSGVLGVVVGIWLWRYPVAGMLDFVWLLGLYALFLGSINLAHAVRMHDE
ncbi:DUF308 domain-containing protein [Candidatus Saccharibacteria bacterium]|nr:DUF308 domain-containing protein [Candidatus Saccharibacteria bacterium]